jgi:phosphoserine aminotransferase
MSRVYNFSAGPAALPQAVLEQAQAELLDWHGVGASVMEISHRDKKFIDIAEKAEKDLRDLMGIPSDYEVLFLQGGATQHFAQIAMNLATPEQTADYVVTGAWGQKAVKEAATVCKTKIAASAEASGFTSVPEQASWKLSQGAAYLHITPNETIHGVEMFETPQSEAPLVADMSSNILSRPIDVSKFGVIYAGAQKNMGPSGIVVLIIRSDLLERQPRALPAILNYKKHAEQGSMLNTPPTFSWYLAGLVYQWLKDQGGVANIAALNARKAATLYRYIDSSGFYHNNVDKTCRSLMNVPFFLANSELDATFLKGAEAAGLFALKGHRDLGGMRASLYNAVPQEAVDALVSFMRDFAARNG